ncbi:hypothetical protein [Brevibacterium sp. VCM10]|uniref:hypothetical protein n=1 Tax=Brevibacterium sp. VCM10 TaxID=1381751 RepID=UPI0012DC5510|nr:hypothetical protein [Brevibacterium sp. VCM10]
MSATSDLSLRRRGKPAPRRPAVTVAPSSRAREGSIRRRGGTTAARDGPLESVPGPYPAG